MTPDPVQEALSATETPVEDPSGHPVAPQLDGASEARTAERARAAKLVRGALLRAECGAQVSDEDLEALARKIEGDRDA